MNDESCPLAWVAEAVTGGQGMIPVILAAYDEADTIAAVLSQLPREVAGHPVVMVVADDGSTDGTAQVAAACGARVVRLPVNRGKATAVAVARRVVAQFGAGIVVEMDADGQHDPRCLDAVVGPVLGGEADLVIGSRYANDPARGPTPLNRYLVRTLVSRLLVRSLRQQASDPFSGYRCYRAGVLRQMRLAARRYDGELELRFEAARCGARVVEVAVPRIYGPATSKMHRRGGALVGRIRVIGQYGAAMVSGSLRISAQRLRDPSVVIEAASASGVAGDG